MIVGSLVLILAAAGLLVGGLIQGSYWLLGGSILASLIAAVMLYIGARQSASVRAERRSAAEEWDEDAGDEYDADEYGEAGYDGDRGYPTGHERGSDPGHGSDSDRPGRHEEPRPYGDGRFDDLKRLHEEHSGGWEPAQTEFLPQQRDRDPGQPFPAQPTEAIPTMDSTATFPAVGDGGDSGSIGEPTQTGTGRQAEVGPGTRLAVPVDAVEDTGPEEWVGGGLDDEDPKDEPPIQRRTTRVAAAVARMATDVLVIDGRPRYHVPGCVHLLGRESEPLPVDEAVDLGFTPCSLCEPDTVLTTGSTTQARH